MLDLWLSRVNFLVFAFLFLWGLYFMITHHNLIKKLIGMYLLQTSIIFLFVTLGAKTGGTVPVLFDTGAIRPELYTNPLPTALMLTAIVVGVSTLGVSLSLVIGIYRQYRTLDEDEIARSLE